MGKEVDVDIVTTGAGQGQGQGQVKVTLKDPSGTIFPAKLEETIDGFSAKFTPLQVGPHAMQVLFSFVFFVFFVLSFCFVFLLFCFLYFCFFLLYYL